MSWPEPLRMRRAAWCVLSVLALVAGQWTDAAWAEDGGPKVGEVTRVHNGGGGSGGLPPTSRIPKPPPLP
jgi:hypothetical protein